MDYNSKEENLSEYVKKEYTDEEIENDPSLSKDEDGVWLSVSGSLALVQPSQSWLDKQKALEEIVTIPEPTELEVLQDDVAFLAETVATSMDDTELIAEEVAYSIDDSVILAETLALVIDELELVKQELATLKGGI